MTPNPNTSLSIPFWSDFIMEKSEEFNNSNTCFQSHFGLILSSCDIEETPIIPYSFNPILVWFYRCSHKLCNKRFYENFQSHFGLILSFSTKYKSIHWSIPFNPILVWFYLTFLFSFRALSIYFQSHFGLILSYI